jgi:hypothetical protein
MNPIAFLKFLKRSHKIISLEVVGMNLLIMNEPYFKNTLSLKQKYDENGKIKDV